MLCIRNAVRDDLPSMLIIYNEAIRNLAATFDTEDQTLEERKIWFEKYGERYPLIVAELEGEVVGYSCLNPYRNKPAYSQTTELSIYVSSDYHGCGIGTSLMEEILKRAAQLKYHTVLSGISGENQSSVKLHKKFGFEHVGCLREVGFKFGKWQDVNFYQFIIDA